MLFFAFFDIFLLLFFYFMCELCCRIPPLLQLGSKSGKTGKPKVFFPSLWSRQLTIYFCDTFDLTLNFHHCMKEVRFFQLCYYKEFVEISRIVQIISISIFDRWGGAFFYFFLTKWEKISWLKSFNKQFQQNRVLQLCIISVAATVVP